MIFAENSKHNDPEAGPQPGVGVLRLAGRAGVCGSHEIKSFLWGLPMARTLGFMLSAMGSPQGGGGRFRAGE